MAVDLAQPFANRVQVTTQSWPKCYRCTLRLQDMKLRPLDLVASGVELPYPVEAYGFVGREKPVSLRGKYRTVWEVECHGERQKFAIETDQEEGEAAEIANLGRYYVFCPNGKGGYMVRRWQDVKGRT